MTVTTDRSCGRRQAVAERAVCATLLPGKVRPLVDGLARSRSLYWLSSSAAGAQIRRNFADVPAPPY